MSFLAPSMLAALVVVPVVVVGYVQLLRRRSRQAAALAAQGLVPTGAASRARARRHVPFALFLLAIVVLLLAFARPATPTSLPHREGTVVLAFDVSNSMRADDVKPTRIEAARAAAKAFVAKQPSSIKIGVVAFSDGGLVTQQPTDSQADVLAAIDRLTPQGGTSLAQGIFTSLDAIAGKPIISGDPAKALDPSAAPDPSNPDSSSLDNVKIGYYGSAAVILLSDGENTARTDPLEVAKLASTAGVKVYTIGLGDPNGTVVKIGGFSVATKLDPEMLTNIADVTSAKYFQASDAASLGNVYKSIDLKFVTTPEKTEVTAVFAAAGALLLVLGAALSLLWTGRVL